MDHDLLPGLDAPRPIVPTSRLGRVGAVLALASVAAIVAQIAADAARSGPDPDTRLGWWSIWLLVLAGGIATGVALLRGERAVLAWVAMIPTALFGLLLLMELVGLME